VYAQPDPASATGYARRTIFRANETIALHVVGQAHGVMAVAALLP